jgi:pimeloyl-ACP methyl ester carboxylesterase
MPNLDLARHGNSGKLPPNTERKQIASMPPSVQSIMTRVIYLHGFGSGPGSRKAAFFRDRLRRAGVQLETPDLNGGNFRELTISGQLRALEKTAAGEDAVLIGSSLGGYIAALYTSRHPKIRAAVLMAPAFNFCGLWKETLGPETLLKWKSSGEIEVYHHAENRAVPLDYQFLEDAARYEAFPRVQQPCLDFHGTDDPVVPIQYSEEFAAENPHVELVRLQSGHELTDVLETIWEHSQEFVLRAART